MGIAFEEFWEVYPRKVGKLDAEKAYAKALTRATVSVILDSAKKMAATCNGKDHQYIPHPATWLNQGRWDDEEPTLHVVEAMRNERYQRTFTDAHYPPRARPGFKPVDEEQKKMWEMNVKRGEF